MSKFIGRKEELLILKDLLNKRSSSLLVIKGRRRIGKSRLLEEFGYQFTKVLTFSGVPPTKKTTESSEKEEFAKQLKRELQTTDPIKAEDWGDLFWELAKHAKKDRTLVILDEISWMGSLDSNFLGKLKNAWDLHFKKNDKLVLAICGSSSAWIEKNILGSTGFLGRVSLTLTLEELPLYDCAEFWDSENTKVSSYEKLKLLAVTGGIPRYLESINPFLSSEENIRRMCFDRSGILFDEFENIFSDLFSSKNILYKNIVSCLANGVTDQSTICKSIGLKTGGDISEYLEDLIKSGFISRDFTWNIKTTSTSNLSHYRLKDNYSRFYLKYIMPNRVKIETGNMKTISLSNLPGWYSILGLQVENLIISNRHLLKEFLHIDPNDVVCDNPFFQRKNTKQLGCQIDYLIQTKHNQLYICEIKYSKKEIGMQIVEEMNEKINRLSLPKHFSYRTVLIHVNGVSDSLEESRFFSHIIDVNDFLKPIKKFNLSS